MPQLPGAQFRNHSIGPKTIDSLNQQHHHGCCYSSKSSLKRTIKRADDSAILLRDNVCKHWVICTGLTPTDCQSHTQKRHCKETPSFRVLWKEINQQLTKWITHELKFQWRRYLRLQLSFLIKDRWIERRAALTHPDSASTDETGSPESMMILQAVRFKTVASGLSKCNSKPCAGCSFTV